jgi:hypothetical protein
VDKFFYLAILAIVTERVTEIIVDSKLFDPIRQGIKKRVYTDPPQPDSFLQRAKIMLDYLINCGYCVSVWIGGLISAIMIGYGRPEFIVRFFLFDFLNWIMYAVLLHGMANLYHVLYELMKRGRVHTYDIMLKDSQEEENK